MAVVAVTEIWNGRRGQDNDTFTGAIHVRVFNVLTDTTTDGPQLVLADQHLPLLLDAYADLSGNFDGSILCVNRVAEQNAADPRFWQVRCEYSADNSLNAVNEPPDISWETEYVPETVLLAYQASEVAGGGPAYTSTPAAYDPTLVYRDPAFGNGDPPLPTFSVRNSAGDPFDPAPAVQRPLDKLVIVRNEALSPLANKKLYQYTVNYDPFQGYKEGQAFMQSITGSVVNPTHDAQAYWKVRYEILFDLRGHHLTELDAGFRFNSAGTMLQCRDPNTLEPYAKPTPLDGTGAVLTPGNAYFYGQYWIRRGVPWAALNLPNAT